MDQNALHNIGYGMYVVSSFRGKELNGQIANTVFQITVRQRLSPSALISKTLPMSLSPLADFSAFRSWNRKPRWFLSVYSVLNPEEPKVNSRM